MLKLIGSILNHFKGIMFLIFSKHIPYMLSQEKTRRKDLIY